MYHPKLSYEEEQKRLHELMLECLSENDNDVEVVNDYQEDDSMEDSVEEREEDSDTEQEVSSGEQEEPISWGPHFVGKDGSKWSKHVPPSSRTRSENLITRLPGPKVAVKNLKGAYEIWKYFFDDDMIRKIVEYINKHIDKNKEKYSRERNAKKLIKLKFRP